MAAKSTGYCGKILAAIFSSLVAPLLIQLVLKDIPDEEIKSALGREVASFGSKAPRQTNLVGSVLTPLAQRAWLVAPATEIVFGTACGAGPSPEAALQDALRNALRQVITTRLDAYSRTRFDEVCSDKLWSDFGDIVLRWQEVGAKTEWGLRGLVHHKQVAIEVDGRALAERLTALFSFGPPNPSSAWSTPRL